MSDDDLRARLARLDPAPAGTPVDPMTSPRARELVERTMRTAPIHDATVPAAEGGRPTVHGRPPWLLGLVAAVILVALVGVVVMTAGGDRVGGASGGDDPTTLALELPPSDVAGSCIVFDVRDLARMPVAFAGTVSTIGDGRVTLAVDRWYRGGDAEQVTVALADGQSSAALDGVDFREGERYLVTATDGTVNGCGFSGPEEPTLEQAFEEAFGG